MRRALRRHVARQVKESQVQVDIAERNLACAKGRLHGLLCMLHGIIEGDMVITRKGVRYRVVAVEFTLGPKERPWVRGRRVRKDGAVSGRSNQLLGDWTKESPCSAT